MQIIRRKKMTLLLADDNKLLRDINDIYTPETKNQDGSITPEHIPYTTDLIFLVPNLFSAMQAKSPAITTISMPSKLRPSRLPCKSDVAKIFIILL